MDTSKFRHPHFVTAFVKRLLKIYIQNSNKVIRMLCDGINSRIYLPLI